uniref:Amine oxidase domain-containing protein n=1 Tax=Amphilophus citrinellus TaxID=61819 RepID=A0A3Q0RND5_AMPCI
MCHIFDTASIAGDGLSSDPKIVIIGCGISGIAAAHRLVKAGYGHVRILEATARSGGRIKTATLGKRRNHTAHVRVPKRIKT